MQLRTNKTEIFSDALCGCLPTLQANAANTYKFLRKVDKVLQIRVDSVISDRLVDEPSKLIFEPIFVDKAENAGN